MSQTLDANKIQTLKTIFTNMEYSKSFESDAILKEWIKRQGNDLRGATFNSLPGGDELVDFCNPMTGESLAKVFIYKGGHEQQHNSMFASLTNIEQGSTSYERSKVMYSVARNVQKNARLLALSESVSSGRHVATTTNSDVPNLIRCLYHCASLSGQAEGVSERGGVKVVVATDSPSPIFSRCWSIFPLLAKGIKLIFYVTVETFLPLLVFADICKQSGLSFEVVITSKTCLVQILSEIESPIDVICQTDDVRIQEIREKSRLKIRNLRIYCNKRSTAIVTDTADILSAVQGCLMQSLHGIGSRQGCRIFVQESIFSKFEKEIVSRFQSLRVGLWNDKNADFSCCMTNSHHVDTLLNIIRQTEEEGATVVRLEKTSPVYLVCGVQPASNIVQKQTRGVVILLIPFRSIKEAIALTNSSPGTEVASVWSERLTVAGEIAKAIAAKTVWINTQNHYDRLNDETLVFSTKSNPNLSKIEEAKINRFETELTSEIDETYKLYYGGAQKRPLSSTSYPVYDPKGQLINLAPNGGKKDARNAVEAALAASPGWKKKSGHEKAQIIYFVAENLQKRRDEFSNLISKMTNESKASADQELEDCLRDLFKIAAAFCNKSNGTLMDCAVSGFCMSVREALGVVAIATQSDKSVLRSFLTPAIAAIACGNTVVAVPSTKYPLAALTFCQILETSDMPGGVVNVISGGNCREICQSLYQHRDVSAFWSDFEINRRDVDGDQLTWLINPEGELIDYQRNATYQKLIWMPTGDSFGN